MASPQKPQNQIDYDALAEQARQTRPSGIALSGVDYDALAEQARRQMTSETSAERGSGGTGLAAAAVATLPVVAAGAKRAVEQLATSPTISKVAGLAKRFAPQVGLIEAYRLATGQASPKRVAQEVVVAQSPRIIQAAAARVAPLLRAAPTASAPVGALLIQEGHGLPLSERTPDAQASRQAAYARQYREVMGAPELPPSPAMFGAPRDPFGARLANDDLLRLLVERQLEQGR